MNRHGSTKISRGFIAPFLLTRSVHFLAAIWHNLSPPLTDDAQRQDCAYELRSNPSMDSTASAHTEASGVPDLLARKGIYAFAYAGTVPRLCDGYRRFRHCIRTVRAHGQRCLCYRFHCYSRSWRRAIRAVEENFLTLPSPTVSPPFSSVGVVLS